MILRCTKKLLDLIEARPRDLATARAGDDDWYANLLWLDRRKCLLLAHAGTLFSVLVADVRKADLLPIGRLVVGTIDRALDAENLTRGRFGKLDPNSVELATTVSRTVLGYMNEMARYCHYAITAQGGFERIDFDSLNRQLRRELHLSRYAQGFFVPIELAAKRSNAG